MPAHEKALKKPIGTLNRQAKGSYNNRYQEHDSCHVQ